MRSRASGLLTIVSFVAIASGCGAEAPGAGAPAEEGFGPASVPVWESAPRESAVPPPAVEAQHTTGEAPGLTPSAVAQPGLPFATTSALRHAPDSTWARPSLTGIAPPQTNTTCASAARVTAGTVLFFENVADSAPRPAACVAWSAVPQLFYEVTVPAGRRVVANARALTESRVLTWSPQLDVLTSCAATTCAAHGGPMSPPPSRDSRVAWHNEGDTEQRVYLRITPFYANLSGYATLTVEFAD